MEYPYPGLPEVPTISLIDPTSEQAITLGPGSTEENQWHTDAVDTLLLGICMLRQDHESGAKELATKALGILLDVACIVGSGVSTDEENTNGPNVKQGRHENALVEEWEYAVRKCGWIISRYGRPSMGAAITAAVVKGLREVIKTAEEEMIGEGDTCLKPVSIDEGIQVLRSQLQSRQSAGSAEEVGIQLRNFIRGQFGSRSVDSSKVLEIKILTLSSSSTIKRALGTLLELELDAERCQSPETQTRLRIILRIMESRPLCEGASMAREVVDMAEKSGYTHLLRIEIASDASVTLLARDIDIVLLGADRISESGDVSNKIGSLSAVLCATATSNNALVVTVSELEKIAKPEKIEEHEEDNDVAELTAAWHPNKTLRTRPGSWDEIVRVRNVYFEWVPAQYIHRYVCEDGPLAVEDVKKRSKLVQEAEKQMFSEFE